LLFVKFQNYIP